MVALKDNSCISLDGGISVSVKGASARSGIAESTLRQWIRERRLPAYRVGGTKIRILVADLEAIYEPI